MRKDIAFWDRLAAKYARDPIRDPAGYERTLAMVAGLLGPSDSVLELGCGTGTTALRLAGGVRCYVATDAAPAMIALARAKPEAAQWPGLEFREAEAGALPAEGFDAVLAFNLLHLLRDMDGALGRIRSALRPGGLFISKTACIAEMNPLIRLAIPPMQWLGKAPFVHVLSTVALRQRIEAAGFEVVALEHHATKGPEFRPVIVARRPEDG